MKKFNRRMLLFVHITGMLLIVHITGMLLIVHITGMLLFARIKENFNKGKLRQRKAVHIFG